MLIADLCLIILEEAAMVQGFGTNGEPAGVGVSTWVASGALTGLLLLANRDGRGPHHKTLGGAHSPESFFLHGHFCLVRAPRRRHPRIPREG